MSEVVKLGEFVEQRRNGDKIRFIVQIATVEMTEEIIQLMTKFFMSREPLTQVGVLGDPASIRDLHNLWREEIARGTSIVALEVKEGEKPKLFGVNITPLCIKGDKNDFKLEGEHSKTLFKLLDEITEMGNVYEKYGVNKYLSGMGLAVDADYHGFNAGQRILECRRPLCKRLGVQVTATVFTAPASQHIASKIGFEPLAELEYATYEDNGQKPFASAPGKAIVMGLKF
uniref:Uncharacterized protein n=1 Tax=Lygus hesperus TaxID=30085 RepID=A0A146KT44_LYGHE